MLNKILVLVFLSTLGFSAQNVDIIDSKDKAEIKQIEQQIIEQKYAQAQKELEEQKAQEIAEKKLKNLICKILHK